MIEKLPLLLHVSLFLDGSLFANCSRTSRNFLVHLIHALVRDDPKAQETILSLRENDHIKHLWVYDDLNNDKRVLEHQKYGFVDKKCYKMFAAVAPNIQDD